MRISPQRHRGTELAFLLLVSIYLLYLPHAEFLLDDWGVMDRYQQARQAGLRAEWGVFWALVENRFHGQFRFQWLSWTMGYLVFLVSGYHPWVGFVVLLALHAACAWLLRQVIETLGIGAGPAYLAGGIFLLLPTTHGALLWSYNCCFFVWSTFWFLLYWRSLARSLTQGVFDRAAALRQAGLLALALFSGDPIVGLLGAAAPLTGWFLRSRLAVRATLLAWGTVGVTAAVYALAINKTAIFQGGVGLRYSFSAAGLWGNLNGIVDTYKRLTGMGPTAFYELRLTPAALGAAAVAIGAALCGGRLLRDPAPRLAMPGGRTLALAAGLWIAAYGPIWFLRGHEFRYDYVPSPYLALGLAAALLAAPGARALAGAALVWLAVAGVADIEQCWKPQSENLRAIGERLRSLRGVERGDLIIVSGTPLWKGSAPHFAFLAGWASNAYAEHVTGVRGLEAAREIADENGRLRVFHRSYMRDLASQEFGRTYVLIQEKDGRFTERRLLAQQVKPGWFRVHALKGFTGARPTDELYSREQISLLEGSIYYARPLKGDQTPADW